MIGDPYCFKSNCFSFFDEEVDSSSWMGNSFFTVEKDLWGV